VDTGSTAGGIFL